MRWLRGWRRLLAEYRIDRFHDEMLRHGATHTGCTFEDGCQVWSALCDKLDGAYDALARHGGA